MRIMSSPDWQHTMIRLLAMVLFTWMMPVISYWPFDRLIYPIAPFHSLPLLSMQGRYWLMRRFPQLAVSHMVM